MEDTFTTNNINVLSNYTESLVVFKIDFDKDLPSENTMSSYLSVCSLVFTPQNDKYDSPPELKASPIRA